MPRANDNELIPFEIALNGKLILSKDPVVVGQNFQSLKNMRYTGMYPKGIGGMSPINASAPSTGGATTYPRIKNAIHFRKDGEATDYEHLLCYAYTTSMTSPKIFQTSVDVPTTGNFSTTPLFSLTDTTTERQGYFVDGCNGTVVFVDGKDTLIWGGDEYQLGRFINFNTSGTILKDYTEQLRNSLTDSTNRAILTKSSTMLFYVGATMPLKGFKCYFDSVSTKNNSTGTLVVQYWSGSAWTAVSSLVDATSSGNKPLRVTGTVSFASTASLSKPKVIDGTALHWYRTSSSGVATNSHMARLTCNTPMQQIVDVWDGILRDTVSFELYNGTSYTEYNVNVLDDSYTANSSQTFVNISGAGYHLVSGYLERTMAIEFHIISGSGNTTASVLTVQYSSDGVNWSNVTGLVDGTATSGKSMNQSGVVSWNSPNENAEFLTTIESEVPLYYYKLTWSAALNNPTKVYYVGGITTPVIIRGYKHATLSKNRLWLVNNEDGKKNSAICSSVDTPNVWNGEDTQEFTFGDESEITGVRSLYSVIGSSIFEILLFFKRDSLFGVTGATPDEFSKFEISLLDGLVAPSTLKRAISYLNNNPMNILIWQGAKGMYLFENKIVIPIHEDIKNFFDPRESNTRKLHSSYIEKSVGFIDKENLEYHWLFADGSSTGNLNREFAFDLVRGSWYEVNRGSSATLQFGCEVVDTNSNRYNYGFRNNGIMCRLENGNHFNSNAINHELWPGDVALDNKRTMSVVALRKLRLINKSTTATSASIIVKHYVDSKTNASSSFTLSPVRTGYRTTDIKKSMAGQPHGIFHSLKFNISTTNESVGFTPIYLGGHFERVREDL